MTDELDDPFAPTELHGFEGTLLDPNWPEVRGIYRGLGAIISAINYGAP
jgi:hypothetical protein